MTEKTEIRLLAFMFIVGALFGACAVSLVAAIHDQDARIAQLEGRAAIAAPFTDIQGHWAEGYIEQIRLAGLTAGCSADPSMFCPDRPLTRAEAAVFMARFLERPR